jgi:uncharacterized LabA/DUF88 family protein
MKRIVVYIDGFNLYFGLRRNNWKKYYWLNVEKLSKNLLKPDDALIVTKYFTSRISAPPDQVKRQSTYLDAIDSLIGVEIFYGRYQNNKFSCYNCNYISYIPNEKKTDVNIAVELLSDAFTDIYDKAIIISADSDLVPPILKINSLFPNKRIVVAIPPGNKSKELKSTTTCFTIGESIIRQSQFPEVVVSKTGFTLKRPELWK